MHCICVPSGPFCFGGLWVVHFIEQVMACISVVSCWLCNLQYWLFISDWNLILCLFGAVLSPTSSAYWHQTITILVDNPLIDQRYEVSNVLLSQIFCWDIPALEQNSSGLPRLITRVKRTPSLHDLLFCVALASIFPPNFRFQITKKSTLRDL